jgi:long-chain acyl-CoA synthetase
MDKYLHYGITFSNLIRKFGIDLRKKFFKPVIMKFGGNLEQIVCGGAPLRTEIIKGFDSLGINIVNGYGITECAPVIATNSTAWKKLDTVGRVLPVCRVRIADPDVDGNGEIQVSGDIVMLGYYKDPISTQASFTSDGYFKTGDLGHLDKENFLYITGRKKNLIILANGKNVCPEELEEIITTQITYVKEVVVYSFPAKTSDQECINAKVFLDEEYLQGNETININEKLNMDIRRLNNRLPVYKRIQNVIVVDQEFEKTTTRKIKRQAAII